MPPGLHYVNQIIINLLLISKNRTTDNLEIITGDTVYPTVLEQYLDTNNVKTDQGDYYKRESYLRTVASDFIVSHNVAIIFRDHVPGCLFTKIMQKKEGIGAVMRQLNLKSSREIIASGYRNKQQIADLFDQKMELVFGYKEDVPFKEYKMSFEGYQKPGIHLLEYFNPKLLLSRTDELKNAFKEIANVQVELLEKDKPVVGNN